MGCAQSAKEEAYSPAKTPEYLQTDEILKKFDLNESGDLDVNELGDLMRNTFPEAPLTEDELKELMATIDLDNNGTITGNELRAFLRCYSQKGKLKRCSALVIIDVQNDFITGTLANQFNAIEIVPKINELREHFDLVVMSYDWHPQEHCSFVESANAGNVPIKDPAGEYAAFSAVTLLGDEDREEHSQMLYPRHAVQNTEGSEAHKDLVLKDSDMSVVKGTKPNIDSYSAFFDNCKAHDTGLTAMLEAKGVTDVYCCGLVFDICVKSSAMHGAEMGFSTYVIEDATRPLSAETVDSTKEELARAGVSVTTCAETVAQLQANNGKEYSFKEFMAIAKTSNKARHVHEASDAGAHVLSPQEDDGLKCC